MAIRIPLHQVEQYHVWCILNRLGPDRIPPLKFIHIVKWPQISLSIQEREYIHMIEAVLTGITIHDIPNACAIKHSCYIEQSINHLIDSMDHRAVVVIEDNGDGSNGDKEET